MKQLSYESFWGKIHDHARQSKIPVRAMFELTYRCNFRCRHCYIPAAYKKLYARGELSTKEVFIVLDQLKDAGCLFLGFTGGEPFMRPDFLQIAGYAKKKGFQVIIYTNGSFIQKSTVRQLKCISPNKVDITLPAVSVSSFDAICGVKGSRDSVFRAIELLHGSGIPVGLKTCVLKENYRELPAIKSFADSLGIFLRVDPLLSRRLDGSSRPLRYRKMRVADITSKDCRSIPGNSKRIAPELFQCGAGLTQCALTPAGELKMCVMIDHPKLKILESSFADCWKAMNKQTLRLDVKTDYQCARCVERENCVWCPARGWLKTKNLFAPDCAGCWTKNL
jgi:MoaA/NifB/PqqE/SkfB family radical SAM enzyme